MLIFVIPAFNEEQNLPRLFDSIQRAAQSAEMDYRIVLVNDGSTDRTAAIAAEAARRIPVHLVSQERNMGVGLGFDLGFKTAMGLADSGDLLVTLEADNTSDLAILPLLIDRVRKEECDVALASCYAAGGDVVGAGIVRRILSAVGNGLLRLAFPIPVRTWSSFYRVHTVQAMKACYDAYGSQLICERGFVCMVEMLVKMHALGLRFAEVSMVLRPQNRIGSSKMKVVRNILDYFRIMYRYRFGGGRHIWTLRERRRKSGSGAASECS